MSFRLVLENSPHPQSASEMEFSGGRLVIGRGDDADWKIADPDKYVSRSHAILTEDDDRVMVTDASSGGLFVDNAAHPIGTGNAVPLEAGMRLRLGDFVIRVEDITQRSNLDQAKPPRSGAGVFSFEFGPAEAVEEPKKRPETLPDPFGLREDSRSAERSREVVRTPRPLDQEDPFGLDLRSSNAEPRDPPKQSNSGFGGYFQDAKPVDPAPEEDIWTPKINVEPRHEVSEPEVQEHVSEPEVRDPFGLSDTPTDPTPKPTPIVEDPVQPVHPQTPPEEPVAKPVETPIEPPRAPTVTADGAALREAFYRGMGIDLAKMSDGNPEEEMERIGRCLRGLVEGVMTLLRTRAEEKNRVRVAQTIIGSANVNPLKFLASTDEGLESLLQPRGKGYLDPEDAVNWAFRDLNDHQMRTWSALQTALRRMIDSFDPEAIEKEMDEAGLMERLLAGGSSAKMWQLYTERYSEIASAAEERFLGEVGADFRDAYENQGRS